MDAGEIVGILAIGYCAGMLGGLVGVGGGVLFVPGLVLFVGLGQLEAESTSLLAIVFVAAVGAWRQGRYGNLRVRDGVAIGLLSPLGVLAGTALANAVTERTLELAFAGVQLFFAWSLARRALRPRDVDEEGPGAPSTAANG
jgi:uncharacterized membrane protein YfcA